MVQQTPRGLEPGWPSHQDCDDWGQVGMTPQLCRRCCALVPLASSEGPLPRVEEDGLDSPWAPCVRRVCGFLQNGAPSPRSGPLVAILGRDPRPRPDLDPPDYWLVMTQGRDPRSRPAVPSASHLMGTSRGRPCSCTREGGGERGARAPTAPPDLDTPCR